ncbi:acetylornithine transaminase [Mycobacterium sp. AT1]|uniref:acetylornithine transaminase n=1 Tax=Mycobacterium sp. AT1 TaxID=1961706 RepID=UPI0009AD24F2|nr:acetylornithine transaminase [Mycobacterium sp. AT1]OPX06545.1 aspartate aminotransferase family protein [Mycobacterium sp. AT1]
MTNTEDLQARWRAVMMDNYGTPAVALVSGDGAVVTDADGKSYVDLLGGIAVNVLGHRHPAVIEAVTTQLNTLGHTSNFYATEPGVALAEALVAQLGADAHARVFFCNSGTEANEVAFKISRLTGRTNVVAAENGFHGRTMGSLALTGQPAKREPFEPLPGNVTHVPYGDVDALERAVDSNTAAVFLEPIMGEGGVVTPPPGYLVAAREITAKHGALLILDEVQTGVGRTGTFYAHQHDGITPDVVTLAKGLGGGLPIGACLAIGDAAELLAPGMHGSTFGGNPVCTAAALAVLRTLAEDDLVARADVLGKVISHGVEAIGHPLVAHVRGRGLLRGIVLTAPKAKAVEAAARDAGFLVNAATPDVVRLAPPLVVTDAQVDAFLTALPAVLDTAQETS